jgi:DMSO reductase family type II enzyme heme b subunit
MTIHAARTPSGAESPAAEAWAAAPAVRLALSPIPRAAQPNAYIRTKWADRTYGTVSEVSVAATCDDDRFHVRLEWEDPGAEEAEFPDAAAVFFPVAEGAPAGTIGADGQAVSLWYWRSTASAAQIVEAFGPGVFHPVVPSDPPSVTAAAALSGGRWSVAFSGPRSAVGPAGALGVVVWDGTNEERAGLAAVTAEWVPVVLPD